MRVEANLFLNQNAQSASNQTISDSVGKIQWCSELKGTTQKEKAIMTNAKKNNENFILKTPIPRHEYDQRTDMYHQDHNIKFGLSESKVKYGKNNGQAGFFSVGLSKKEILCCSSVISKGYPCFQGFNLGFSLKNKIEGFIYSDIAGF